MSIGGFSRFVRTLLSLIGNLGLLLSQFLCLLLQFGQLFVHAPAAALIQHALGTVQLFERLLRGLLLLLLVAILGLLLHVACCLLQGPADVGHLAVVVFPGQLIELARKSLCFLLQVLSAHLITCALTAPRLLLLGSALHQLLLAFRKLLQFLKRFIDSLRALFLFSTLQCFVLILVLIEF